MRLDIYHLYRHFEYSNFVHPIILDVLKVWAREVGVDARVHVCREQEVDYNSDADAVGISVYTQTALASYRVSRRLRENGKVTVLGGPHFRNSTCEEALPHCDVVVDTICREQWVGLLQDIRAGKLMPNQKRAMVIRDSQKRFEYPANFYDTFKDQKWFQIPSVPTSLGCPYECSFCSAYLQGRYQLRSIDTVYNELKTCPRQVIFICDATFGLNKRYTMQLMERVAPLKKKLLVETTLARLQDVELIRSLSRGGIKWVSVGIESLSAKLGKHGSTRLEDSVRRVIGNLHDHGILIQGNFICGLDSDGPESFAQIYEFYRGSSLDLIIIDLLTPYPNTAQYAALVAQGRIIDHNWEHYDYRHVVYRPEQMTPEQLIDGFIELYRSITRPIFVLRKAQQIYQQMGANLESALMMSYNAFSRLDGRRKEIELLRNRQGLTTSPASLSTPTALNAPNRGPVISNKLDKQQGEPVIVLDQLT